MPGWDRGTPLRPIAAWALALCACGSVGDPLPPLLKLPLPVNDLAARQVADSVEVSWSWPLLTTEGTVPRQVGGFTLWAVDVPDFSRDLPRETIDGYRRPVAVLGPAELEGRNPGDLLEVRTRATEWELGQLTVLAVTGTNRAGRHAGYSNQVRFQALEAPEKPQGVAVSVRPTGVELAWQPAARAEEYAIERAVGEDGQFAALGRLAVASFLDRTVEWSETHRYRLRPFRKSAAGWIEGPLSDTAEVTPHDTFPPAPPSGLRAVRTPAAVELSWLPSVETDAAGYRVQRDGTDISGLIVVPAFSDASAEPSRSYEYAVTAEDIWANESAEGGALEVPANRIQPD